MPRTFCTFLPVLSKDNHGLELDSYFCTTVGLVGWSSGRKHRIATRRLFLDSRPSAQDKISVIFRLPVSRISLNYKAVLIFLLISGPETECFAHDGLSGIGALSGVSALGKERYHFRVTRRRRISPAWFVLMRQRETLLTRCWVIGYWLQTALVLAGSSDRTGVIPDRNTLLRI
jgi:hypothetical protein